MLETRTTEETHDRILAVFENANLLDSFDRFVHDEAIFPCVEASYDAAAEYLSQVPSLVPEELRSNCNAMLDKLHAYTLEQYVEDLKFNLMNRWYGAFLIFHTLDSSRDTITESDANRIREALNGKHDIVVKDLQEIALEMSNNMVQHFAEQLFVNMTHSGKSHFHVVNATD